MGTGTEQVTFGPPDAGLEDLADFPDAAFGEEEDEDDLETPDDGEPDGLEP
jgi:hypothetical protein